MPKQSITGHLMTITACLVGGSRDGRTVVVSDPPPLTYNTQEGPQGHRIRPINRRPGPYVSDYVHVYYDLQWWVNTTGVPEARYIYRGSAE